MAGDISTGSDGRLTIQQAIKSARKVRDERYAPFWRRVRAEMVGPHYRRGEGIKRLVNYPYLFASTYAPNLVARRPNFRVVPELALSQFATAEAMRLSLAGIIRRNNFLSELRLAVFDSFYAFGFMKIGLAADGDPINGVGDPGFLHGDEGFLGRNCPFAERISPFNAIWDEDGEDFKRCNYVGHEFLRTRDAVLQDDRYDRTALVGVPTADTLLDDWQKQRLEHYETDIPAFYRLIELFVRPTRKLYTLIEVSQNEFRILRKVDFWGPHDGPFYMLGYTPATDRVVPISPFAAWWEQYMELELNERKLNEQAQSEKRFVSFEEADLEAAKIAKQARDDGIVVGAKAPQEIRWGGITPERQVYVEHARKLLERSSGISDVRIGIDTSGGTATEANLVNQNASIRIRDMRAMVAAFTADILHGMGFYQYYDPSVQTRVTVTDEEGLQGEYLVQGGMPPDPNAVEWDSFAIEIDVESMFLDDSVLARAQAREDANFVLSVVRPALMSQGADINMIAFSRRFAEKAGIPELEEMIVPLHPMSLVLSQHADGLRPDAGQVEAMAHPPGPGSVQPQARGVMSGVMNAPETNGVIQEATRAASPLRQANTAA